MGRETAVRVSGLGKTFHRRRRESVHALRGVDLEVAKGELLVLLGPSGCGKTTFLRCLVGMERATHGAIHLAGEPVVDADRGVFVPPNRRNVGMVFQNYALWPHMKVRDNVAYPLKARKRLDALRAGRVDEVLQIVQCAHLADRYPPELSGGQQQRISLARALAAEPALLLLDEPLSNLDALLRVELRAQLRELHRRLGFTAVYVTHDQEEALALGTRVAVMSEGEIHQLGTPPEVYRRPATSQVADFLGAREKFDLTMGHDAVVNGQRVPEFARRWPAGEYTLRLRPSRLLLRAATEHASTASGSAAGSGSGAGSGTGSEVGWLSGASIVEVLPGVDRREHVVVLNDQRYLIDVPVSGPRFEVGDDVAIGLPLDKTLCYDTTGTLVP